MNLALCILNDEFIEMAALSLETVDNVNDIEKDDPDVLGDI